MNSAPRGPADGSLVACVPRLFLYFSAVFAGPCTHWPDEDARAGRGKGDLKSNQFGAPGARMLRFILIYIQRPLTSHS